MGIEATPAASSAIPVLAEQSIGLSLYTGQQSAGGRRYGDLVPLVQAAETAGFDAFWVSEHHDFDGAYLPSPLVALAAAAAATRTIVLGTGVALAPLVHPVRLAEDAAVLDHLSGGRLVLGLGAGYVPREFAMAGVPRQGRGARTEEAVAILRRAWRGERFSFDGRAYPLDDVRVRPTPFQEGGVPIWIGGYAAAAIRRAGRVGDGHLVGRGAPELLATATAHLEEVRRPEDPAFTLAMNLLLVGDDPDAGGGSARAAYRRQQRSYELADGGSALYAPDGPPVTDADLDRGSLDAYVQLRGDASGLARGIAAAVAPHRRWRRRHVALRALFPDEDLDVQLRRIEYLGRAVLPEARRLLAGPSADAPPGATPATGAARATGAAAR